MNDKLTISLPAVVKWTAAFAIAIWVAVPQIMQTLAILMAVDYAFGLGKALVRKELSSEIGKRGLITKTMLFVMLLVLRMIDQRAGLKLGVDQGFALGYIVNEAISIVENAALAGVPVPAKAVEFLLSLKHLRMRPATAKQLADLAGDGDGR